MLRTVIAGAKYFNKELDHIYIPLMTGEFWMVDCERYVPKDELFVWYENTWIEENENNYIENEGDKYYYAEYGPENIEDLGELISDISDLRLEE